MGGFLEARTGTRICSKTTADAVAPVRNDVRFRCDAQAVHISQARRFAPGGNVPLAATRGNVSLEGMGDGVDGLDAADSPVARHAEWGGKTPHFSTHANSARIGTAPRFK